MVDSGFKERPLPRQEPQALKQGFSLQKAKNRFCNPEK